MLTLRGQSRGIHFGQCVTDCCLCLRCQVVCRGSRTQMLLLAHLRPSRQRCGGWNMQFRLLSEASFAPLCTADKGVFVVRVWVRHDFVTVREAAISS